MNNNIDLSMMPFARRHRRARYAPAGGRQDWIWVLIFGGIIAALAAGFFILSGTSGGGSTCSKPLAPLGDVGPLSAQAFQEEDVLLGHVVDLASAGDRGGAESAFYGKVHNFTHNVDPPLRKVDANLGKDLCHAVLDLEAALTSSISSLDLSTKVARVRELLRESATALGYPRPN